MKLSSGMYQRLGIARALIKRPSVLLLDEPTRSLDPSAAGNLWGLVRELSSGGITIVLATHNFAEAVAVADRIAVLQRGELLALRHTGGLTVEQLRSFYLEVTGECESRSWLEEVPA
jgi:ABC-2 type transport system ATP-binding protein